MGKQLPGRKKLYGELFGRIRQFRTMLRAKQFDTAIDMQSLLKRAARSPGSRCPRRIGLGSREGSQWLMTEVVPKGGIPRRISPSTCIWPSSSASTRANSAHASCR